MSENLQREEVKKLFEEYYKTKSPQIREKLILYYQKLVINLARRFANRGEPLKDLIQVGTLGLMQSIDRFNPKRGSEFLSFATPTILGEIKKHFRDKGWTLRVPRKLKELNLSCSRAIDKLVQELGRSPTILEIANYLNVHEEDVNEALELGHAYNPLSLDATIFPEHDDYSPSTLLEMISTTDKRIESLGERAILKQAFNILTKKERTVIYWRFYGNLTQMEIAKKLNISQMQISRLQNKALKKIRQYIQKKPD